MDLYLRSGTWGVEKGIKIWHFHTPLVGPFPSEENFSEDLEPSLILCLNLCDLFVTIFL